MYRVVGFESSLQNCRFQKKKGGKEKIKQKKKKKGGRAQDNPNPETRKPTDDAIPKGSVTTTWVKCCASSTLGRDRILGVAA